MTTTAEDEFIGMLFRIEIADGDCDICKTHGHEIALVTYGITADGRELITGDEACPGCYAKHGDATPMMVQRASQEHALSAQTSDDRASRMRWAAEMLVHIRSGRVRFPAIPLYALLPTARNRGIDGSTPKAAT